MTAHFVCKRWRANFHWRGTISIIIRCKHRFMLHRLATVTLLSGDQGREAKRIHIERILPDAVFFDTICERMHTFVQRCVIPELLAKVFTAPVLTSNRTVPSDGKGCYCGVAVLHNEDRLECKSGICKRQCMHKICSKLDNTCLKMSSWKCSDCVREIAKHKRENGRKV